VDVRNSSGFVVGVDMTPAMLERARRNAGQPASTTSGVHGYPFTAVKPGWVRLWRELGPPLV